MYSLTTTNPLAALHLDSPGPYRHGAFSTLCTCGQMFHSEHSQDAADAAQSDHVEAVMGANPPAPLRGARRAAQALRLHIGSAEPAVALGDALTDLMHLSDVLIPALTATEGDDRL